MTNLSMRYTVQGDNRQQILKMIGDQVKELGSNDQICVSIVRKNDHEALVKELEREGTIF